jgi:DNA-binding transcriptional ArsR family regulator
VTGERRRLDYELDDILEVRRPDQFRAVGDPTRQKIISLLSERAATTSQLAEALGQPKGSVGHHLKVLEEAGLIRVVRTRQVRAITEKYYGRTARFFEFIGGDLDLPEEQAFHLLRQAMNEYALPPSSPPGSGAPDGSSSDVLTLRHARIPASRAEEFSGRLLELADEFTELETVPGERVYGLLAGLFLTNLPELPDEE